MFGISILIELELITETSITIVLINCLFWNWLCHFWQ